MFYQKSLKGGKNFSVSGRSFRKGVEYVLSEKSERRYL